MLPCVCVCVCVWGGGGGGELTQKIQTYMYFTSEKHFFRGIWLCSTKLAKQQLFTFLKLDSCQQLTLQRLLSSFHQVTFWSDISLTWRKDGTWDHRWLWQLHQWFCPCPFVGQALVQGWQIIADSMIFFLGFDGSAMVRDGILIPRTGRLALLLVFLHYCKLTKIAIYNLHPTGSTQSLFFSKISTDFSLLLFPARGDPFLSSWKIFTFVVCWASWLIFTKKTWIYT